MSNMSRYNAHNMQGPDCLPGWCAICGRPYPERHHVVPRSLGGHDGPLIHLCGRGNALRDADGRLLHHGAVETHRMWLWWCDGTDADIAPDVSKKNACGQGFWAYVLADEPVDEMTALALPGWRAI